MLRRWAACTCVSLCLADLCSEASVFLSLLCLRLPFPLPVCVKLQTMETRISEDFYLDDAPPALSPARFKSDFKEENGLFGGVPNHYLKGWRLYMSATG